MPLLPNPIKPESILLVAIILLWTKDLHIVLCVGLNIVLVINLPEDGIVVPKHVAVDT